MFQRCIRCLSIGLVCSCLVQGVKAPPANVVGQIMPTITVSTSATSTVTATGMVAIQAVNTINGTIYRILPGERGSQGWKPPQAPGDKSSA